MKVVLYLRYSSDKQTEQSIEGQDRVCRAFCEKEGHTVVDVYIDRALSASKETEKRESFLRMIKDSAKQKWEAVVVYKLDRFARNRFDSAIYKDKLKRNGVRVLSATEAISQGPEGIILESVLEGMAEFYSQELAQKVRRGMFETAAKCNSVGGQVPLGYKIDKVAKKYVIDEPSAQIVREAFDLYANGKTVLEICEIFNNKGYRTSRGVPFNKNSFSAIFKNERYIGIYKYDGIRTEGGIPAIVDKEVFDIVQRRMKSNRSAPGRTKAKVDYLLSQKMFCGHCGSSMIGESCKNSQGNTYHYYTCSTKKKDHTCHKRSMQKDWVERIVVQDALSLLTPESIERIADIAVKEFEKEVSENTLLPQLRAELKEKDKAINNIVKTIERGVASEALINRLTVLEDEKKSIGERLKEAQSAIIVLEKPHIIWWLSQFINGDIENETFRKHVIDLYVHSVTVWDDPDDNGCFKFTVKYNLTERAAKTFKCSPSSGGDTGEKFDFQGQWSTITSKTELFFIGELFGQTTKHRLIT